MRSYTERKWEKKEGCNCLNCREVEYKVIKEERHEEKWKEDSHENKWDKNDRCDCYKCREKEDYHEKVIIVNSFECNKDDDKKDHGKSGDDKKCSCHENKRHDDDKKCDDDKCKGPKDKVELQNDEQDFRHQKVKERPQEILEVTFEKLCFADKVWLSGVVGFDNDNHEPRTVTLTITKRVDNGMERTILTQLFEIDGEHNDDITQVPFAKVDTIMSEQKNVTYTVRVEREDTNNGLFLDGLSTLTALRVG
ncbi:MAG: hypothetical protein ABWX61_05285 [Paenisporosarcina sp.]